mmetsp:Transcript_125160/g.249879  ORF Transcript_125160/g.249879 Transcript_125160/m.249879 type:complete len:269 (-) Transcript_125160:233-1039(-)
MGAAHVVKSCIYRHKVTSVLLDKVPRHIVAKTDGISGAVGDGHILVFQQSGEVASATVPRCNGILNASKHVERSMLHHSKIDGSADIASSLVTTAICNTSMELDLQHFASNASANSTAVEESGSPSLVTPLEMPNCNSLTQWYSSPEGSSCNNNGGISTNAEDIFPGPRLNRSLSNWYLGNMGTEFAPPPPTNTIDWPPLGQQPCHYYDVSSFTEESVTCNGDEGLGSFRLVHGNDGEADHAGQTTAHLDSRSSQQGTCIMQQFPTIP